MVNLIKPADSVIAKNRRVQSGITRFRFPSNLGAHAMVFNFKDYEYRSDNQVNSILKSSVALPLPNNIQDSFIVSTQARELGISGSIAATVPNVSLQNAERSLDSFGNLLDRAQGGVTDLSHGDVSFDQLKQFGADASTAARFMARNAMSKISAGVTAGIDVGLATTINPHLALAFDGINLKIHNFDWILSPKSESESSLLRDLINEFKKSALPQFKSPAGTTSDGSGNFLSRALFSYPSLVDIFFVGLDQAYFYYFKTCMITQIDLDYSPNGNALFKGDTGSRPVAVNFRVSLTETEVHTRDDYDA
jgi:hypothetical protein